MFWEISLSFFILLLIFVLHKFIIKPLLAINYYKKQGFKVSYFYPLMGMRKLIKLEIEKYNDFQHHRKMVLRDCPSTRGMVSNALDNASLILIDSSLKKDYFVYKQAYYEKHPFVSSFFRNDAIEKKPSLLLAEGEYWKKIRQILSKTFHYDFIMSNVPLMSTITNQVFDKITDMENVNLMNEFQTITGNVILSSMLGDDFLEKKHKGVAAPLVISTLTAQISGRRLNYLTVILGKKISQRLIPSFRREMEYQEDFYKNFLIKYIDEKFEEYKVKFNSNPNIPEKYLIDSLFKLVLSGKEQLSLNEICSNINILFLAGTDTTGHLLAHIVYVISKNPEVYKKLMKEIEKNELAIEKCDIETIKNMEYLNAVIKEGLRQVTPANDVLPRVAIKDHYLGDVHIKKGTNLLLGISINCYDPKIFRDPFEFRPERWIKNHELFDNAEEKDPYCFLPFSAGARNCIGQHMALIEAKLILAKFLNRYDFEMKVKEPLTWVLRFVVEPKDPLIAKLTEKNKIQNK